MDRVTRIKVDRDNHASLLDIYITSAWKTLGEGSTYARRDTDTGVVPRLQAGENW